MKRIKEITALAILFISAAQAHAKEPMLPDSIANIQFGTPWREFVVRHPTNYNTLIHRSETLDPNVPGDGIFEPLSDPGGDIGYTFINGSLEEVTFFRRWGEGNTRNFLAELTRRCGQPHKFDNDLNHHELIYQWKIPGRYIELSTSNSLFGYRWPSVSIMSPAFVKRYKLEYSYKF